MVVWAWPDRRKAPEGCHRHGYNADACSSFHCCSWSGSTLCKGVGAGHYDAELLVNIDQIVIDRLLVGLVRLKSIAKCHPALLMQLHTVQCHGYRTN